MVLADQFDEVVARYGPLPVEPDVARRREQAAAIANDWVQVEARLFGSGAAAGIVTAAD
jgi:hypothetical protein